MRSIGAFTTIEGTENTERGQRQTSISQNANKKPKAKAKGAKKNFLSSNRIFKIP